MNELPYHARRNARPTAMLSGFAKNPVEKDTVERIAHDDNGSKTVKYEIAVHP